MGNRKGGKLFLPGNPDGPAGRPRGSKTRLTAAIVADMYDSWHQPAPEDPKKTKGQAALEILYKDSAREYVRLFASAYIPKDVGVEVKVSAADELTDDEIDAGIDRLRAQLAEELAKAKEPPLLIEAAPIDAAEPVAKPN